MPLKCISMNTGKILTIFISALLLACGKFDKSTEYYDTGELKANRSYNKGGQLHGLVKEYYKDGNLSAEFNYANGTPDGIQKLYYENGKIKRKVLFEGGTEAVMEDFQYDDAGKLIRIWYYEDGQMLYISKTFEYYEDGKIKREWNYIDGKQVIVKEYDDNKN